MAYSTCGLHYIVYHNSHGYAYPSRCFLPQVKLAVHTTILNTSSRSILTQTFVNPSPDHGIREAKYSFPLYDGVSVIEFTCHVGERIIIGKIKEKEEAKAVYKEAVSRGETAGLLEQLPAASDCFTTTIGNIPPKAEIGVEITYLGELKHDAEVDGMRFTIPTSITPRYGAYPSDWQQLISLSEQAADTGGIEIIIDAIVGQGSFISELRSPTHPIAVSIGTTSTDRDQPQFNKASATLSLGTAILDQDFVLQVIARDTGAPVALLETHPTIPQHRALMATLVPKFALPAGPKPEVVFICDRSGSMGSKIHTVQSALKVFLKSLPVGVMFNICSFGSTYNFLWNRSRRYDQTSLDEAVQDVDSFRANYGGTEIFEPVKATINRRYNDIPLEIFLVTDGQIWNQQQLFDYLNKKVIENDSAIRVFTLGIGSGASTALVEGVARAGNGFAQMVLGEEKLEKKIVRMLKGALTPHITDYTMEIKYADDVDENSMEDQDNYEIIEKVTESLKVNLILEDNPPEAPKKPVSLFDPSMEEDPIQSNQSRSSSPDGLSVPPPKLLQAPHKIPPLFPFVRTTIYLLMSPSTPQRTPQSIVLHGTSASGPLTLELPIEPLQTPSTTIHQLAAKRAVHELEQGRGWLSSATCASTGALLRETHESRFEDLVRREAVRLGTMFQIAGKWTSFVAVEEPVSPSSSLDTSPPFRNTRSRSTPKYLDSEPPKPTTGPSRYASEPVFAPQHVQQQQQQQQQQHSGRRSKMAARKAGSGCAPRRQLASKAARKSADYGGRVYDAPVKVPAEKKTVEVDHERPRRQISYPSSAGGGRTKRGMVYYNSDGSVMQVEEKEGPLEALVRLQLFDGSWVWCEDVFGIVGVQKGDLEQTMNYFEVKGVKKNELATTLVLAFLEKKLQAEKDAWELVAEKAKDWLREHCEGKLEEVMTMFDKMFEGMG